jgi:hypothetical protein
LILILIGFGIAFSMVQTAVNYLLQFAAVGPLVLAVGLGGSGSGLSAYVAMLAGLFLVMSVFAMAMAIFMRIFQQGLWTSFFRQMTGLEPPARAVHREAPVGTYYPPPYQPTLAYRPPPPPPPAPQSPVPTPLSAEPRSDV